MNNNLQSNKVEVYQEKKIKDREQILQIPKFPLLKTMIDTQMILIHSFNNL